MARLSELAELRGRTLYRTGRMAVDWAAALTCIGTPFASWRAATSMTEASWAPALAVCLAFPTVLLVVAGWNLAQALFDLADERMQSAGNDLSEPPPAA